MNSIKRYLSRNFRDLRERQDASYCRAPVALATCDGQKGRLLLCNLAFADLMGYANATDCTEQFDLSNHLEPCAHNETMLSTLQALHSLSEQTLFFRSTGGTRFGISCNLLLNPESGNMEMALLGAGGARAETDLATASQLYDELQQCQQSLELSLNATNSTYWEWDLTAKGGSCAGSGNPDLLPRIEQNSGIWQCHVQGVRPEDMRAANQALQACMSGRQTCFDGQFRQVSKEGEERWIKAHGEICARDSQGEPQVLRGLHTDITELKQAQEVAAELQVQVFQAQKMHAIGQLTGGFAHDFNNILASVIGYTTLLLEKGRHALDPALKDYLLEVYKAGELGQAMIAQMLRFARNDSTELAPAMISLLTRDAVQLIRPAMPSSIDIQLVIDDQLPSVKTNAFKLSQMLMNLCVNAKDAMQGSGTLEIRLKLHDVNGLTCTACKQQITGQFVMLVVTDSGAGISEQMFPHIFADFFTTKQPGEGTGMGLAIVNNLIHEHHGHIHVVSSAAEGTSFGLLFPPTRQINPDQPVIHLGTSRFQPLKRGHILVVDDDLPVGHYLAEVLRLHGHRVTFESQSLNALDLLQEKPHRFDVVVTDQVMPGITGTGLLQAAKRIRKDLPVVICSGDNPKTAEAAALGAGAQGFLTKPINVDRLLQLIDQSLG